MIYTFLPPFTLHMRVHGTVVKLEYLTDNTARYRPYITVKTSLGLVFRSPMPPGFEKLVSTGDWVAFDARVHRRLTRNGVNYVDRPRATRLDR